MILTTRRMVISGAVVLWLTLIMLCALIDRNTQAVKEGNHVETREEFERVLLGCNTAGAHESTDPRLREMCDEFLDTLEGRVELTSFRR